PGTYAGARISKLLDTLRRVDGTSWLDDGFFEGQLIKITGIGGDKIEKIDLITGTGPKKLDLLVLTDHPAGLPGDVVGYSGRLGAIGTDVTSATLTVTQMAARVTFTPPSPLANKDTGNWFTKVTIPVIGDPWFDIQP